MGVLRPEQIKQILELTDSLNLNREAIFIPLTTTEKGDACILPNGRLRIICPSGISFDEWLRELRSMLEKMDLSVLGRSQPI